jgi:hypothetical protein
MSKISKLAIGSCGSFKETAVLRLFFKFALILKKYKFFSLFPQSGFDYSRKISWILQNPLAMALSSCVNGFGLAFFEIVLFRPNFERFQKNLCFFRD